MSDGYNGCHVCRGTGKARVRGGTTTCSCVERDLRLARETSARLTRERDEAREAVREVTRERDEARAALAKIDAIRDDIIGRQSINWSAHIYPLVKALGEAGYEGAGYDVAHERARTADDAIRELVEALRPFAAACDGQGNVWPVAVVGVDGEHWRRACALVEKYSR